MLTTESSSAHAGLLQTILAEESYRPAEPNSIAETSLPLSLVEGLILKRLSLVGTSSGRQLAEDVALPFNVLEPIFQSLRTRQIIVHKGSAPVADYVYGLTESGQDRARLAVQACAYVGPAPVPLMDYVLATEAQTIRAESPKRRQLQKAFSQITINESLFESLGPAINSGAGLFLYGEPGNGKSTLARLITSCFGQYVWIPYALFDDGQIIKLYDAAYHHVDRDDSNPLVKDTAYDRRWVKIRRPTVMVGGELTLDALEIRHDPALNICEAPLQLKSNCGCMLIDDFGRQRVNPQELLNRWIVPLESGFDFLSLPTGKKIEVPFEHLIIFSTNLEPSDLVDEAFMRRIPYKIEIGDPDVAEFHSLFQLYCEKYKCEYRREVIDQLIATHFEQAGRAMRRCHPRDLLQQIRNFCAYNELPIEIRPEYFDRAVASYFANTRGRAQSAIAHETTAAPSSSR
jgi:predicted ATPase with chaperone activity